MSTIARAGLGRVRLAKLAAVVAVAGGTLALAPATHAFPGANGEIYTAGYTYYYYYNGAQAFSGTDASAAPRLVMPNDGYYDGIRASAAVFPEYAGGPANAQRLVYSHYHSEDTSRGWRIWTSRPDGTDRVPLTSGPDDHQPAFNAAGTKVAFIRSGALYTVPVSGGTPTAVPLPADLYPSEPRYAPSGDRIAFSAYSATTGNYDIYWVHDDGTGLTQVTNDAYSDQSPDWKPDGTQLAFSSQQAADGSWDIFRIADGGGAETNVSQTDYSTSDLSASEGEPSWSPDGTSIAYNDSGRLFTMPATHPSSGDSGKVLYTNGYYGIGTVDWATTATRTAPSSLPCTITIPNHTGTLTVNGTSGRDVICASSTTSTAGATTINAGDGNDVIRAGGAADTIKGGTGDDWIDAGAGNDVVDGGKDGDIADGGAGTDTIDYSTRNKDVSVDLTDATRSYGRVEGANEGDGLANFESVKGGLHNDSIVGNDAANTLNGGAGDDYIDGRGGNDTVNGGTGNDTEYGGDGDDKLDGATAQDGSDYMSGGNGFDSTTYARGEPVSVTEDGVDNDGGFDEFDNVQADIESITGGKYDDYLALASWTAAYNPSTGLQSKPNVLAGAAGNDTLLGSDNKDTITGTDGADTIYGYGSADTLTGGLNTSALDLGDVIDGGDGADTIAGGQGADDLTGGNGADTLKGEKGADTLRSQGDDSKDTDTCGQDSVTPEPQDTVFYDLSFPDTVNADCEIANGS